MFLTISDGNEVRFAITTGGPGAEQQINGTGLLPLNAWSGAQRHHRVHPADRELRQQRPERSLVDAHGDAMTLTTRMTCPPA